MGESGCGKTTTGRLILRAYDPTGGEVWFNDRKLGRVNVATLDKQQLRQLRQNMQLIFQDPYSSLNPRMTLLEIVGEPLYVNDVAKGSELKDRVAELLKVVGLRPEYMTRYPHAFSGGQRQRIGVARALALQSPACRLRRAGLGARRFGPGADPQPAPGPAGAVRPDLPVHLARPERGRAYQRPGGRDVRGQAGGERRDGRSSSSTRGIPTPKRCFRPCPSPIRASARSRSCCRAKWPIRLIRPAAAISIRAAGTA